MNFRESGLPQSKLLEDAFNFSYAHLMGTRTDMLQSVHEQLEMMRRQAHLGIEQRKRAGLLGDDDYKAQMDNLKRMHEEQLKQVPAIVDRELKGMFIERRLKPARELVAQATAAPNDAVAAALLVDCVRSPLDFLSIQGKFGESVARAVAEAVHVDVYPSERVNSLTKASTPAKTLYSALMISTLDTLVEQAAMLAKQAPGQILNFSPGQEQSIFEGVKTLWGNDKKLDKRIVDVFNKAATAVRSNFRMEVDAQGRPELVKDNPPPSKPPVIGKTGGTGSIGNDVF